ncbi:MAG: hypothetical protein EOP33_06675 [Rickettsiaceae bacterium]|nr:MAG: hypothetical protein EOP33_06675 [Rickettsiaceae bacterium]
MNKSKFSLGIDSIDQVALSNFAKGASTHNTESIDIEGDWKKENPNDLPSYNFRLRLNKYQIGLLKHVANIEKRSLSNMIKVILTDELQKKMT